MSDDRRLEPGTGNAPASPEREWTFMVYLAGDNNLEHFGREDLQEMKEVGSTSEVAIVAQFDRMREGATRRYYLRQGTTLEEDEVGPPLGETNTGDPGELVHFLAWATATYPAKRYALVLWNHGTGWKEDDVYKVSQRLKIQASQLQERRLRDIAESISQAKRPPLFLTPVHAIFARGIAYDDTSQDFLDNAELKRALSCSLLLAGIPQLDLLGFDACLMNMIEVAYQVKDFVSYLVGSEETEPGGGWPYTAILQELVNRPQMQGDELAHTIVQKFLEAYSEEETLTQSALDLSQIPLVAEAINALCAYVLENPDECELIIGRAARRAQKFSDPDYRDLYDFCRLVYQYADKVPALQERAQAVMDTLWPPEEGRLVIAEGHKGYRMRQVYGVSIYFPQYEMSPFYKRLDFASETLWDDMLHQLFGI